MKTTLTILVSVFLTSCFTTTEIKNAKRSDDSSVSGEVIKQAEDKPARFEIINGVLMLVEDKKPMAEYDRTIIGAAQVESQYKHFKGRLDKCLTETASKKYGGKGGLPSNYGYKDVFAKNKDFTKTVTIKYEDGTFGDRVLTDWKKKADTAKEIHDELLDLRDTSEQNLFECEANLELIKEEHALANKE